ncbi:MAG: FmdB family zinc ribbon protein [Thermoleophilaceae bacterium]
MPIYEYRCERGHTFEVMQSITDDPLTTCSTCQAPVQRVFHPVAVHFKGSGFYTTDYGPKRASESSSDSTAKSDGAKDGSNKDSSSSDGKGKAPTSPSDD